MVAGTGVNHSHRDLLKCAMEAIRGYEESLSLELLKVLADCTADVYGIRDKSRIAQRVPTILFNLPGISPATATEKLAATGIGVRDGHMYSPRLMKRLGLSQEEGAVRVSLVHYNTLEEIHRFGQAL